MSIGQRPQHLGYVSYVYCVPNAEYGKVHVMPVGMWVLRGKRTTLPLTSITLAVLGVGANVLMLISSRTLCIACTTYIPCIRCTLHILDNTLHMRVLTCALHHRYTVPSIALLLHTCLRRSSITGWTLQHQLGELPHEGNS